MSDLADPRVLFAAERTLLAWVRTSVTMMGLGFVVERFGLFLALLGTTPSGAGRSASAWIGTALVIAAVAVLAAAVLQHRTFLSTLGPGEIPPGYRAWLATAVATGLAVAGAALAAYLLLHPEV